MLSTKDNFEFWNHGLTHYCGEDYSEFENTSYEYQLSHLQEAQQLFKDKFGITLRAFNVPCMNSDENTTRALADIEDIKIWFYGRKNTSQLYLDRNGNIEFPYGYPDYNEFVERYNQDRLEQYDHLALQVHPGFWIDETRWDEFLKIMDYLFQKEVVFMTASEYYQSITAVITVTNSSNSGGDLDIASDLAILGAGADSTIIDGNRSDRVLHIHSGRVGISGVTIRHGRANSGAGIRVDGGTVTIRNCLITWNNIVDGGNQEENGGAGIYAQNAKVTISGCTISNNKGNSVAGIKGGGIYINQSNTGKRVDIRNCLIEGNTANKNTTGTAWGGGVYLSAGNPAYEVTLFNNTFKNNIAGTGGRGEGGGLYLREIGNANLERNCFIENVASVNGNGFGGAIFADGGAAFNMTNNLLVNNNAGSGAHVTGSQLLWISNSGTGTLNWTAEPGESWIRVRPPAGRGPGLVTITIDPTGLTGSPFGFFVSPQDGAAGVTGAIPVTGWALDDIQVDRVEIYREQAGALVFVDNAIFVEGARPDVEQAYPDYPFNYKAGWGYMMLTNFLPNRGSGTFTFYAVAADKEGNRFTLGSKTITCDNANAVKPFGSIDTPAQGGSASGKRFPNWGWVLTPQPNRIPLDGSTINVWVNGVNLGHPTYNIYRADIANLFPGYFNSDGAVGYFYLDTTVYKNGIHTISWTAEDSAGNKDGIGSRYFLIRNIGGLSDPLNTANTANCNYKKLIITSKDLNALPVDHHIPLLIKKGYRENIKSHRIYPGDKGITYIKIRELERVEIRFSCESSEVFGYLPIGNQLRPLPVGSTLNAQTGTFCWQPGPGFVGVYRLNFIVKGQNGEMRRSDIIIEIQ